MESCNSILKFCLLYDGERLLPLFLSCYVVGSCACRSWFLINSKWNTEPIKFKLMQKVCDVHRNYWNKVSQNITEEFSWKLQWPVYKNNTVHRIAFLEIHQGWVFLSSKLRSFLVQGFPFGPNDCKKSKKFKELHFNIDLKGFKFHLVI